MFKEAADLLDYDGRSLKTVWGQFWAAHQVLLILCASLLNLFSWQRFFKYLCIAAKVPSVIDLVMQSLRDGKVCDYFCYSLLFEFYIVCRYWFAIHW